MNRSSFVAAGGLLSLAALLALNQATSQSPPQPAAKLPGARPAIEAINYPTLQAALDALPATGGIVRLPAGTVEINEPLRITHVGSPG